MIVSSDCVDHPDFDFVGRQYRKWKAREENLFATRQDELERLAGDDEALRYLYAVHQEQEKLSRLQRAVAKRRS